MPFLVDGDNLLGSWKGRSRSDAERQRLAGELRRFASRERRSLLLVFDGTEPPGLHLGADVRFAGPGRSADELILALLRDQEDRRGWTVVTSDRSLGDQCRYMRARVERCDRFRSRLADAGSADKPEREFEVDYWLERFTRD